jgi:hypothetical protein
LNKSNDINGVLTMDAWGAGIMNRPPPPLEFLKKGGHTPNINTKN